MTDNDMTAQFDELLKLSGGSGCGCAVSEYIPNQIDGGKSNSTHDELIGAAAKKRTTAKKKPSKAGSKKKKKPSKAGSKKKPSKKKTSRRKKSGMDSL